MLVDTFWKILLKIIGLWILFGSIAVIPQFSSTLSFMDGAINFAALLQLWGILILSLLVYITIVYLFIFKTDWIIDKLKLDKNFKEERIELQYNSSSILTIAIIVMGGLILIEALPSFLSRLYDFFKQSNQFKDYHESGWLIYYFIKIILGYVLLTNGKAFSNYVEKKVTN